MWSSDHSNSWGLGGFEFQVASLRFTCRLLVRKEEWISGILVKLPNLVIAIISVPFSHSLLTTNKFRATSVPAMQSRHMRKLSSKVEPRKIDFLQILYSEEGLSNIALWGLQDTKTEYHSTKAGLGLALCRTRFRVWGRSIQNNSLR